MKKHIVGFAIFTLIVSSAVVLNAFFYSFREISVEPPPIPDSSWKMNPKTWSGRYSINSKSEAPITYKLRDWSFDSTGNVLTAKVELNWNGIGKQPDAILVQLNFFSLDNPSKEIPVATESIKLPFKSGNTFTKTITAVVGDKNLVNPEENYYGSINISSLEEVKNSDSERIKGKMTIIIYNNEVRLAESTPVLMIHEK